MHKVVNGVSVALTQAEIDEIAVRAAEWEAGKYDRALAGLRGRRDSALKATDWYALGDVTMPAEITAYRQALRDITDGLDDLEAVNAVDLPVKP
ncbi:MAG: hypothetical protein GY759_17155 [Chloroflexi bacterium]|nr:hypothetical protein [Chloroflexota bacterium]